jgi:TctA family transporter
MVVLGLLLGLVGTDVNSGARRFNFGMTGLADGVEFVALSMAIYGIAEVVYNLEKKQETSVVSAPVGRVWPSLADLRLCVGAILRGTSLGAILGVLPGAARCSPLSPPIAWRRTWRVRRATSATAIFAASPRRNPLTMPARRPRSFRCSPWAFPATRPWR